MIPILIEIFKIIMMIYLRNDILLISNRLIVHKLLNKCQHKKKEKIIVWEMFHHNKYSNRMFKKIKLKSKVLQAKIIEK